MVTSKSAEVGDRILKVTFCFILMKEIWKDIEGYEGYYQVSNLGRVRSVERIVNRKKLKGKFISYGRDTKGYLFVNLSKENKQKTARVHRLVAQAFIPKIDGKDYIDHIDGSRDNNNVSNLRWCTHKENCNFEIAKLRQRLGCMGNKKWLGKHHTEETKKKISESKKGKKNPNLWNSISDENKKKILNAAIEKNRVEVEQYSLDGKLIKVWDSMVEAARSLGVWNTNIHKCCNGQAQTCGGFIWKYHNKKII